MYYGEANIHQENLDTFLSIAEEFQLKGLNGPEDGGRGEDGRNPSKKTYNPTVPSTGTHRNNDTIKTEISSQNKYFTSQTNPEDQTPLIAAVALPMHEFSGDMKELDEKIESLMCRGENIIMRGDKKKELAYVCKVCGKEGKNSHIKDHIERIHLGGISVPCNLCGKTFKSRDSLRLHNSRFHRDSN